MSLTCHSILKKYLIVILLIHCHWMIKGIFPETCFLLKNGTRTCRTLERAWVINVDTKQLEHKHIKHIANACGSQGRDINPKTPEHSEVKDKPPTLFWGWLWRNFNPIADLLNINLIKLIIKMAILAELKRSILLCSWRHASARPWRQLFALRNSCTVQNWW